MAFSTSSDPESFDRMADFFGPGQVDQTIRQAIHFCWMALPKERKDIDELAGQITRIVTRALKDYRDDSLAFGRGEPQLPKTTTPET